MSGTGVRRGILTAVLAVTLAAPSQAVAAGPSRWGYRIAAAKAYAQSRAGTIAFAIVDQRGRLHGYRRRAVAPSASVLKPMLLVAYLRKASVRDRPLTDYERSLLGPMIRRSDNNAASTILGLVGRVRLNRLARITGMTSFRLVTPYWGHSTITPRDQAHYFHHIDRYIPSRHRRYAMRLLATIVPSQRWGIAQVAPDGWKLYFKSGWGSGTGLVDHQVALLRLGKARVSLCITTRFNPDHEYGKHTLRGVARRLVGRRWWAAPTPGPR
jgi:Beta-lactamase enzyme family